jgi:hypothetical protein
VLSGCVHHQYLLVDSTGLLFLRTNSSWPYTKSDSASSTVGVFARILSWQWWVIITGRCLICGQSPPQNYYTVAARLGDADAQQDLAFCLAKGKGCKKDMKAAAKWYREAVSLNDLVSISDSCCDTNRLLKAVATLVWRGFTKRSISNGLPTYPVESTIARRPP